MYQKIFLLKVSHDLVAFHLFLRAFVTLIQRKGQRTLWENPKVQNPGSGLDCACVEFQVRLCHRTLSLNAWGAL